MSTNNSVVPEGLYTCITFDITNGTNSKQEKTVRWKLKVVEGQYTSEVLDKWYTLNSDGAKDKLMKELVLAQLPVCSGAELEARKSELDGRRLLVEAKKNKDGYMSFYIKGLAPSKGGDKPKPATSVDW